MAKPSHGGARFGASKKKAKKRSEPQQIGRTPSAPVREPSEPQAVPGEPSGRSVVQFRPRPRDAEPQRVAAGRGAAQAKSFFQAVDYSYVYTDLRIIGGLSALLFGGLVVLSFVIR